MLISSSLSTDSISIKSIWACWSTDRVELVEDVEASESVEKEDGERERERLLPHFSKAIAFLVKLNNKIASSA